MKITKTVEEMRAASRALKASGRRVGFVPTMGALHEGHLSLVRSAGEHADAVVASIFVNPTQFGANEDLSRYPRPFERDRELLEREGVEVLFAPTVDVMYPKGAATFVTVEGLDGRLDGGSRPGHFRGVATVVTKLLHIVEPDVALFGQKDAAQHAVIRRMVRDLDLPVEIVIGPIVREADGLAMSSRNVYLSAEERKTALVLSRALQRVQELAGQSGASVPQLLAAAQAAFDEEPLVKVDYIAAVDPDELTAACDMKKPVLFAVAAWVGSTRLIDNVVLKPR